MPNTTLPTHLPRIDWTKVAADLDDCGWALLDNFLSAAESDRLAALYPQDQHFRSRVIMSRHNFGRGEYKYFAYPLPTPIAELRSILYPHLATIANRWNQCLGVETRYPATLAEFLECCHSAGQSRPTPLLLQYGAGDFNCLHQDLYGEQVFPLQVAMLLSQPGVDFEGGEFVLTEQRPRMQSRAHVVPLRKGSAVIFAVHRRPQKGARGYFSVNMRHGVSRIHCGRRLTAGIIFHDAT